MDNKNITPKLVLGKPVNKLVWGSVYASIYTTSVESSACNSLVWNSVWELVWTPINNSMIRL